MLSVSYTLMFF